jgi:hypothetical protein
MVRTMFRAAFFMLTCLAPLAAQAGLTVSVDLSSQSLTVAENGAVTHRWPISSGRIGYRTPNGVYRPQRLARMHYSRKYGMSPMPHSIFFRGGYAIHGTGSCAASAALPPTAASVSAPGTPPRSTPWCRTTAAAAPAS